MRVLGGSRRQLRLAQASEFAAIGLLSGLVAAIAASVLAGVIADAGVRPAVAGELDAGRRRRRPRHAGGAGRRPVRHAPRAGCAAVGDAAGVAGIDRTTAANRHGGCGPMSGLTRRLAGTAGRPFRLPACPTARSATTSAWFRSARDADAVNAIGIFDEESGTGRVRNSGRAGFAAARLVHGARPGTPSARWSPAAMPGRWTCGNAPGHWPGTTERNAHLTPGSSAATAAAGPRRRAPAATRRDNAGCRGWWCRRA